MGSTRMKIEERIDVEALLKSIGSLQDLQFRQQGLEQATQQVADAAKALFKADGAGLMLIGQGEVLRWVTATDPRAQVLEAADVAFQRMRSAARSSRRPVAEVAQIVVDGGPWGLPRKDS